VSVDQFSEDLRRHLAGLPVIARKDTLGYRTAKFVRRNRGAVAAAIVVVLSLLAGILGTGWQASEARRERARAEQRFDDVRSLAHAFIFDLHDSIRDLPGSTPARQLLVSKGLEHRRLALALMQTIAATVPDDLANVRQLGIAYQKLGNTLGNPNYPNVGDLPAALEHLEKAHAIFSSATTTHPSNAMVRRNLAVINSNTADVLSAMNRSGAALARQREAEAAFKALADADPSNVAARNDVAISLSKIAEMLDAAGRSKEAIIEYERALEIHQALAAADPENDTATLEVASDHNRLATAQAKLGMRAASLANHDRAVAMSQALRSANPKNVELTVAVALARLGRGDAYAAFGRKASGAARVTDLQRAERDYLDGIELLARLQQEKAIDGTDVKTLENARTELTRIRADLSRRP
jgi:non-specific serine/threonine protein kinase/serine/threonine-protein kinase